MEEPTSGERIRRIIDSVRKNDATFTSVATVVTSVLRRVRGVEVNALREAISLAQREMLTDMCDEVTRMIDHLETSVPAVRAGSGQPSTGVKQWWFALSEATETVSDGIEQLSAVVGKQKKGSPVRDLAALAVRVLRDHKNSLQREARDWMDN